MNRTVRRMLAVTGLALGIAAGFAAHPDNTVTAPVTAGPMSPSPVIDALHPTEQLATPKPVVNKSLARAVSCTAPWNPKGWCWFEGWEFRKRSVCIETNIPGAPVVQYAAMYRVSGLSVSARTFIGACKGAGYAVSQTIVITAYTAADLSGDLAGACAYTSSDSYYNPNKVFIRVHVTGYRATACGNFASGEWVDVFGHELGHAFGLSHEQESVSSIMRDGHTTSAQDRAHLTTIYSNNPL